MKKQHLIFIPLLLMALISCSKSNNETIAPNFTQTFSIGGNTYHITNTDTTKSSPYMFEIVAIDNISNAYIDISYNDPYSQLIPGNYALESEFTPSNIGTFYVSAYVPTKDTVYECLATIQGIRVYKINGKLGFVMTNVTSKGHSTNGLTGMSSNISASFSEK